jgi:hypothetical protein
VLEGYRGYAYEAKLPANPVTILFSAPKKKACASMVALQHQEESKMSEVKLNETECCTGQMDLESMFRRMALEAVFDIFEETLQTIRTRHANYRPIATINVDRGPIGDLETRRWELGTHRLLPNTRNHRHSATDYRYEERTVDVPVWVEFEHPSIADLINDCIECAKVAGTASVIAAVATGNPATGYELFYPVWKACMLAKIGDRVNEIGVTLGADEKRYGCWTYHPHCH